jgi:hypothetical protein
MRASRKFTLGLTALLIAGVVLLAGGVAAQVQGSYDVVIEAASCTEVSFSYELVGDVPSPQIANVTVEVDGSMVYESQENPFIGSMTVPLALGPGTYTVTVIVDAPEIAIGSASVEVTCGGGSDDVVIPASGRVCFGPGAVRATVFAYGGWIEVYAIDPSDHGELVMMFTQTDLKALPARPEGPAILIAESERLIPISFYRNSNGLYRVVAGPDIEDKYYECTFGGACSAERTWIGAANAPLDEVVPVCAPPQPQPTPVPTVAPTPVPTVTPVATVEVRG